MIIDIEEFVLRSGIETRIIEEWIERQWLVPDRASARIFLSDVDAARASFIRDLQIDMGVNDDGIDVVLHLVDQVHGLRRALQQLRTEILTAQPRSARRPRSPSVNRGPRRK